MEFESEISSDSCFTIQSLHVSMFARIPPCDLRRTDPRNLDARHEDNAVARGNSETVLSRREVLKGACAPLPLKMDRIWDDSFLQTAEDLRDNGTYLPLCVLKPPPNKSSELRGQELRGH